MQIKAVSLTAHISQLSVCLTNCNLRQSHRLASNLSFAASNSSIILTIIAETKNTLNT